MKRIAFLIALAAFAASFAASVSTTRYGNLRMNDQVVTNVDLSGLSMTETDPEFGSFTNRGGAMYGPLRFPNTYYGVPADTTISSNGVSFWKYTSTGAGGYWAIKSVAWNDFLTSESLPNVPDWATAESKPTYGWDEITNKPSFKTVATSGAYGDLTGKPTIPSVASDVGAYSATDGEALSGVVATWETYWDGDEVRVTVTNYDSTVHMPSLEFEQKVEDDVGGTNYYRTVWNELTRWNWFLGIFGGWTNNVNGELDQKADRAWGYYDSHTGNYAPDGYTWLSSPKIAIAGGLAYQRTLTTDGAIWVLASNGMVAETGGNITNGFFRIKDDEGNTTFEIVRGNKRTVGATASGIRVTQSGGNNVVTVPYNVVSEAHPTIYGTTDLEEGEWTDSLSVEWLGQSGAYTAIVTSASSTLFLKAEYEIGGETYIRNAAPISAEGGIYCTDGIHKVRPVYNNGSITWEVVQ